MAPFTLMILKVDVWRVATLAVAVLLDIIFPFRFASLLPTCLLLVYCQ